MHYFLMYLDKLQTLNKKWNYTHYRDRFEEISEKCGISTRMMSYLLRIYGRINDHKQRIKEMDQLISDLLNKN